jgi:hypothetical protein
MSTICPARSGKFNRAREVRGPMGDTPNGPGISKAPGSLASLAPRKYGARASRRCNQLLISDDHVFSICFTTESGIGM